MRLTIGEVKNTLGHDSCKKGIFQLARAIAMVDTIARALATANVGQKKKLRKFRTNYTAKIFFICLASSFKPSFEKNSCDPTPAVMAQPTKFASSVNKSFELVFE